MFLASKMSSKLIVDQTWNSRRAVGKFQNRTDRKQFSSIENLKSLKNFSVQNFNVKREHGQLRSFVTNYAQIMQRFIARLVISVKHLRVGHRRAIVAAGLRWWDMQLTSSRTSCIKVVAKRDVASSGRWSFQSDDFNGRWEPRHLLECEYKHSTRWDLVFPLFFFPTFSPSIYDC